MITNISSTSLILMKSANIYSIAIIGYIWKHPSVQQAKLIFGDSSLNRETWDDDSSCVLMEWLSISIYKSLSPIDSVHLRSLCFVLFSYTSNLNNFFLIFLFVNRSQTISFNPFEESLSKNCLFYNFLSLNSYLYRARN